MEDIERIVGSEPILEHLISNGVSLMEIQTENEIPQ